MALCMVCARRCAMLAALAGGTMIAVALTGWCANGIVWGGSAGAGVIRSGLGWFGL